MSGQILEYPTRLGEVGRNHFENDENPTGNLISSKYTVKIMSINKILNNGENLLWRGRGWTNLNESHQMRRNGKKFSWDLKKMTRSLKISLQ